MVQVIAAEDRWSVFDYIGVVCYTGYKDRVEELMPELDRVGLRGRARLHWDLPSIFKDRLFAAVGKTKFCSRPGCFAMTVAHYTVVKTAYELGCGSVLVMEDDMRFLKDLTVVDEMLAAIPRGYDHLMLDRNKLCSTESSVFSRTGGLRIRNVWMEFDELGSTGCYAMSRRGMKRYIDLIERDVSNDNVHNPDHYFRRRNKRGVTYWDETYKRYFAFPNIAVQSVAGSRGSFSNLADYWSRLMSAGIRLEDYNISAPIVTRGDTRNLTSDGRIALACNLEEKEPRQKYRGIWYR